MAIMNNSYHPHYHTPKLIGTGIGLGIVAALDVKPSSGELLIKHSVISSPRSVPIPVTRAPVPQSDMDYEDDEDENFTYVTSRGPTNNSVTRVYHHRPPGHGGVQTPTTTFVKYSNIDDENNNNNNNNKSDFLSSCDLCSKSLEGKDIYMYRGEKAFCSGECRERQISIDERKEKMSRSSSKRMMTSSSEMVVSRSPCYFETGQIFTTGIIATY